MGNVARMIMWGAVGAALGALVGGRAGAGPGVALGAAAAAFTTPKPARSLAPLGAEPGFLETAWRYYTGAPAAAPAEAAPKSGPASGVYGEGGYVYRYSRTGGTIVIVANPRGSANVTVQPGSAAYKAIYAQIASGVARPMSPDEIRAARKGSGSAPARGGASRQPGAAAPAPATEWMAPAEASAWADAPSWLVPVGVGVGALLLLGAFFVLRR